MGGLFFKLTRLGGLNPHFLSNTESNHQLQKLKGIPFHCKKSFCIRNITLFTCHLTIC
jgi:hypothetical protein